mmetsp:Transcript_41329/g.54326  ORF Transcript_41329/g.54326 Transcript_41329/m.54326 type:complete len:255 (-) Transcript_41329:178-942(-)|eukprot:CAMPEP_0117740586 /NCGR_PEP_ID=MMETSP0947-20121206/4431_1 /TAXON_ID=44440 /ORGANISM="Chattonella subsalsa, Strain CCMP2191" /LENGTH=254 /DNA_ID=CAMNT_0005556731 /DNA_START=87 /DNA_END=851 /DNA_ORIENTATION=+
MLSSKLVFPDPNHANRPFMAGSQNGDAPIFTINAFKSEKYCDIFQAPIDRNFSCSFSDTTDDDDFSPGLEDNSVNPEMYFLEIILRERGYSKSVECALSIPKFEVSSEHRMRSYTPELINCVRSGDCEKLQAFKVKGLSMSACNKFGESIVHIAARTGQTDTFKKLLNLSEDNIIHISDDMGKTVLHDACWSGKPNFEIVRAILDRDPFLFCVADVRGATPLAYVKKGDWDEWCDFLDAISDTYWPFCQKLDVT